jgi:hypothetical protein
MVFQHGAIRLVQPRDHDELVTDFHSEECVGESRFNLQPGIRRPFRSLARRIFTPFHRRSYKANRLQRVGHPTTFFTLSKTQLSGQTISAFLYSMTGPWSLGFLIARPATLAATTCSKR